MAINKYLPFAILYFFFNTAGLPHGLTWMTILCPWLYCWIFWTQKKEPLWPFWLLLSPFVILHFIHGVEPKAYLVSFLNLTAVYIFARAFHVYARRVADWERILQVILVLNFALCLLAIPFYFTPWWDLFWIEQYLTEGFDSFRRLKLFTYEASYYATLFVPVFFFFLLKILLKQNRIPVWLLLPMLALPYLLSFSIGVLASIFFCIGLLILVYAPQLLKRRRVMNALLLTGSLLMVGLSLLAIFYPGNPLFVRIENILTGHDSSGKGRTSEAFMLAKAMIALKSECWGIGFGQIKILGESIVRNYYNYDAAYAITLPNASAETLAVTGWAGFVLRLLITVGLFFYTRVWRNYFRFLLFAFVFLYQFTGSYITSQVEYMIWILAFTNIFPEFDVPRATVRLAPKTVTNDEQ